MTRAKPLGTCHHEYESVYDVTWHVSSSSYFPVYDDEYERVCYDDDHHHASHDTRGFANLRTSLREARSTMMGLGGANFLGIHACMCGLCVGKYYTSNFVRTGGHPNDMFLIMSCMYLHSLTPIVGSLTKYFLKYSSFVLFLF